MNSRNRYPAGTFVTRKMDRHVVYMPRNLAWYVFIYEDEKSYKQILCQIDSNQYEAGRIEKFNSYDDAKSHAVALAQKHGYKVRQCKVPEDEIYRMSPLGVKVVKKITTEKIDSINGIPVLSSIPNVAITGYYEPELGPFSITVSVPLRTDNSQPIPDAQFWESYVKELIPHAQKLLDDKLCRNTF